MRWEIGPIWATVIMVIITVALAVVLYLLLDGTIHP